MIALTLTTQQRLNFINQSDYRKQIPLVSK